MKTMEFITLSEQQVKAFNSLFTDTREKYNDRKAVLNELRKGLKKMGSSREVCDLIEKNWSLFNDLHMFFLPHYTLNGKVVPCDFVVKTDKSKMLCVRNYRFDVYSEVVKREVASELAITEKVIEKRKIKIGEFEKDGVTTPVYKMDGDKFATEEVEVIKEFVPRDKTSWGFTEPMRVAFLKAIDALPAVVKAQEEKNAKNAEETK